MITSKPGLSAQDLSQMIGYLHSSVAGTQLIGVVTSDLQQRLRCIVVFSPIALGRSPDKWRAG
jgi:hypothetical protein